MSFNVQILADSLPKYGDRLTSMLITFPRYILAEKNTHRILSRNSASSRAIPYHKMVKAVQDNPFIPVKWMKDHPGMQGTEYFSETETCKQTWLDIDRCFGYDQYADMRAIDFLKKEWLDARDNAILQADSLHRLKVTKQICNRLLEPFMWHTVLVSGTEWENFFALRDHPDADIHMQMIAELMLKAYNTSIPKKLQPGEWHIPYGDIFDEEALEQILDNIPNDKIKALASLVTDELIMDFVYAFTGLKVVVATSRCAQTSYTVVGEDQKELNYIKLISLHDKLLSRGHMSPFEHCARAMNEEEYNTWIRGKMNYDKQDDIEIWDIQDSRVLGWCGNFRGFIQYRKMLAGENRTDNRVIKHTF